MSELLSLGVCEQDGRIVVNSRDVARVFSKNHKDVLKAIKNLEIGDELHERNFVLKSYSVQIGNGTHRESICYDMTRDGFALLAMGFTGAKAMQFKIQYIEAFNAMEEELRNRSRIALPTDYISALEALLEAEKAKIALEAETKALTAKIEEDAPMVEFAEMVVKCFEDEDFGVIKIVEDSNGTISFY